MQLPKILVLAASLVMSVAAITEPTCSPKKRCPEGYECKYSSKVCLSTPPRWSCQGKCVKSTPPPPPPADYPSCGGFRINPRPCDKPNVCIDDPRTLKEGECGLSCDKPGICAEHIQCGGFTGAQCPKGLECFDYPNDGCDPKNGGADCGGICLRPLKKKSV
jgi:hypothetical protein